MKRKILLKALTSPMTALPFLGGMSAFIATWALGLRPDIGILAGLAGLVGAGGTFLTKLIVHGESYAKEALQEAKQEESVEHERTLDELAQRMAQSTDPRDDAALHDLRSLTKAFEELRENPSFKVNAMTAAEIVSGVEALFQQCVHSLEQTLKLWHTARQMKTKAARDPILKQRDQIMTEIGESIAQLGRILAAMQNLGATAGSSSDLERIGKELDQRLAVARQVEQRMKTFENQLDASVQN